MSNPFNEERREKLKDDAKELLEKFSIMYLKSFGISMFLKAKDEVESEQKEKKDPRKLTYREFDSVERSELWHDWVYMKKGAGPGDMSKWKKVYIAEGQDYSLEVYGSDKDFEKKKKPNHVISPAGYHLERDVSTFYRWELKEVGDSLGLSEAELEVMTSFSSFAWALVHPWRPNYVFQLHKGKDPACGCLGGGAVEPEGAGSEFSDQREVILEAFDGCVTKNSLRDTESVKGMAFQMTCDKIPNELERLVGWKDDGTESEMLTDALMAQCLIPMRDDMMADLKGPVSFRLVGWYKLRGTVYMTLSKLVDPAWSAVEKAADKIAQEAEPVLKAGLGPILEVKSKANDKVRSAVGNKIGQPIAQGVTPHVQPVLKAFDEPLTKGFACCRDIVKQINVSSLPADTNAMRSELDQLPRTPSVVEAAHKASMDLIAPLRLLQKVDLKVFDCLDVWQVRSEAEMLLLTTLDAAILTLQNKIEEEGQKDELKDQVLKDFDHDMVIGRSKFMKDIIKSILITNVMKLISPITEPVVEIMNDVIPEDLQNILNVEGIIDEVVDIFVGEPIVKVVDAAYPPPK